MPRYYQIRNYDSSTKTRSIQGLLRLREKLDEKVPVRNSDTLLLATWNIRDFDSNKFGHGPRLNESFHYIAEIVSRFDIVAIQEVNRDLGPLKKLVWLLGPEWDYLVTGVTEGSAGNTERMVFVFNKSKVQFTNLAGQIILPRKNLISSEELQFARAPYIVSFQAGWFKFNLCTVHIYFGESSGDALERRIEEIKKIADFFNKLNEKETADYILLGDFNIVSPNHRTMEALLSNGFQIPENLQNFKTNLSKNKHYDQIAFKQHDKRLEFGGAGVFDFRDAVFREADFLMYYNDMKSEMRDFHLKGRKKGLPRTEDEKKDYYYKEWITWQMSDHLLLWTELKVDFTKSYLTSLLPGNSPLADFPPEP